MINVLVADDELPAVEELAFLLGRDDRIGTIYRASSGTEALRALEAEAVDAVFLDIHMPALSGLDIARVISRSSRPPAVVFVTADEDCALEAFELAAVDYLLKPVRAERLAKSIGRISELLKDGAPRPEMITVDLGGTTKMIRREDVTYVQAQGDYARLHTADASYLIRVPLADLEQQWAEAGFHPHPPVLPHRAEPRQPHEARRRPSQCHRDGCRTADQPAAPAVRAGEA